MLSQKTTDKTGALISPITGLPMLRVYRIEPVTVNDVEVYVRAQYWEDQHTGELAQDVEQAQCKIDAARLAAESNEPKPCTTHEPGQRNCHRLLKKGGNNFAQYIPPPYL